MEKEIIIIAALARNCVIGKGNTLPWRLPDDMKFFANTTTNHTVIMGRKSWDSIPSKYKPLPNRRNIVLSKTLTSIDGAEVFTDIESAIEASTGKIFIIGGAEIYKLGLPLASKLMFTTINAEIDGDVKFPDVNLANYDVIAIDHHPIDDKHAYSFNFVTYQKIN